MTGRFVCFGVLLSSAAFLPLIAASVPGNTPSRGLLLVANKGDQTIGIIDPEAGRELTTIKESGFTTHEVVASPDGRTAYAPIYGNSGVGKPGTDGSTIDVIDLASRRRVATIDLGVPARPHCALFGPKDGLLYVTTELEHAITVIDPKTQKIVGKIPTGQPESHMLAITHDGRRGYTANVGPGTVSALDLVGRKTVAVIPISGQTQRISISMDDHYAFTSDQTQPRLAVIDTATNKVTTWVAMPGIGYGTAPTPDGKWLLVCLINVNKLGAVDLKTMKVERTLDVEPAPQEVVVRPDGAVAYVSCDRSRKIAVIDLSNWKVKGYIDAGRSADGLAWVPVTM
jgi:DNA-binding beta-propeller fold protein YncE